jgi:protein-disulfide isomerase
MQLGGVAIVVVALIAIVLVATGGKGGKTGLAKTGTERTSVVSEVTSLLSGIPQSENVLGNPHAPVTIQYFGDLECPFCKQFTLTVFPTIVKKFVSTGKAKVEYLSLETATRNPSIFVTQQVAALAAGKQNKMWYFVELFYHEQGQEDSGYVSEKYLQGLAEQVPGLNLPNWTAARGASSLREQVLKQEQEANQAGFTGTPSFLLGKTGGKLETFSPSSLTEAGPFSSAIEAKLK